MPVTTIEPVLVSVPAKLTGLLGVVVVAIVIAPELVMVTAQVSAILRGRHLEDGAGEVERHTRSREVR